MTFNEFYQKVYLPAHSHYMTRFFHLLGFTLMIAGVGVGLVIWNIWPAIAGILINVVFAVGSHLLYEKNRPVFIKTPKYILWTILCEARLWWES